MNVTGDKVDEAVLEILNIESDDITGNQLKTFFLGDQEDLSQFNVIALTLGYKYLKQQNFLQFLDQDKVAQLEAYLIKLSNEPIKSSI